MGYLYYANLRSGPCSLKIMFLKILQSQSLFFIKVAHHHKNSGDCEAVFCVKILQNSQENFCARVSFLVKLQASGLQLYYKRDCGTGVSLWIWTSFLEQLFLQNTFGGSCNLRRCDVWMGIRTSEFRFHSKYLNVFYIKINLKSFFTAVFEK